MGIKGLTQLIKLNAPDAIETTNLYKLSGKKVAIDASIFMYKMLINMRSSNGKYFTNKEGKIVSHINGIFYKTINYLSLNIEPIYVFDGKPPDNKQEVLDARNEKVVKSKLAIESTTNEELKKHLEKQTVRIKQEHVDDIKHLLRLMGVTYIQADGEAEAYASEMCRNGCVDYVVTEDMDSLTFGCPRMIRTCLDKSVKRKDIISVIHLDKVLEGFKLTYQEFIDLCILCGCDYCKNIPRIGNKTAYSLVQKYRCIEELLTTIKIIPDSYEYNYQCSRKLFTQYHDTLDIESCKVTSTLDIDALSSYLIHDCSMSEKRVQNSLKKISHIYK